MIQVSNSAGSFPPISFLAASAQSLGSGFVGGVTVIEDCCAFCCDWDVGCVVEAEEEEGVLVEKWEQCV